MNEIKCPHCGEMFTIDEAGFAAILKQVRDAEFDKEVRRHEQLLTSEKQQAVQLAVAEALAKAQGDAAQKEARIAELESRTVKLPPKVDSSNIPFAGHTWNCCLDEVEKRLAAAGIKWEAE